LTAPLPGDSAQIVAVPGLGLSTDAVRRALDRVPRTASSVVLLPAFGRTALCGTALTPRHLAAQLSSQVEEPVVLIGHSASCQVVAEAAVMIPNHVRALVLIGPTTDPRAASWHRLLLRWLHTAVHERPHQVPVLARDYATTGLASMARGMNAARHHRIDDALASVRCPVLVVRGHHDHLCRADWAQTVAAAAPQGRVVSLPFGGHMITLTHPDALASRITTFLTSV
jgi:pimeloyl-ACP methyl ester carboxylesterase